MIAWWQHAVSGSGALLLLLERCSLEVGGQGSPYSHHSVSDISWQHGASVQSLVRCTNPPNLEWTSSLTVLTLRVGRTVNELTPSCCWYFEWTNSGKNWLVEQEPNVFVYAHTLLSLIKLQHCLILIFTFVNFAASVHNSHCQV